MLTMCFKFQIKMSKVVINMKRFLFSSIWNSGNTRKTKEIFPNGLFNSKWYWILSMHLLESIYIFFLYSFTIGNCQGMLHKLLLNVFKEPFFLLLLLFCLQSIVNWVKSNFKKSVGYFILFWNIAINLFCNMTTHNEQLFFMLSIHTLACFYVFMKSFAE